MANSAFFAIFAPALVKDTPYGVGRPSSEASPFGGAFVIIAPFK
jgi:hypothetical protein